MKVACETVKNAHVAEFDSDICETKKESSVQELGENSGCGFMITVCEDIVLRGAREVLLENYVKGTWSCSGLHRSITQPG